MRRSPYDRLERSYLRTKQRQSDPFNHSFRIDSHKLADSDPVAPRTPHGYNPQRTARNIYHRPVTTHRPSPGLEHRSTFLII